MCEMCRRSPCHPRCPNADPPKVIGQCVQCGQDLTADYTYYSDADGNLYCSKECALDYIGVTEEEYDE